MRFCEFGYLFITSDGRFFFLSISFQNSSTLKTMVYKGFENLIHVFNTYSKLVLIYLQRSTTFFYFNKDKHFNFV